MKKLFLGAAIAVSSLTFAQQFGVKGGLNVSSISKDGTLDNQGSKIGFNAGVFANFPVASSVSNQPEVIFTQYGDKFDRVLPGSQERISWARHMNYIAIPVMFQYNVIPNLYLEAGPEFGFLVDSKFKTKNESTNTTLDVTSLESMYPYNKFNFGLGIGAGYWFTDNVGINARYVAGMNDVTKNVTFGGLTYDDNNKNNVFQVGLNYKF